MSGNAIDIKGLGVLFDAGDTGINFTDIEQEILKGSSHRNKDMDIVQSFQLELDDITRGMGAKYSAPKVSPSVNYSEPSIKADVRPFETQREDYSNHSYKDKTYESESSHGDVFDPFADFEKMTSSSSSNHQPQREEVRSPFDLDFSSSSMHSDREESHHPPPKDYNSYMQFSQNHPSSGFSSQSFRSQEEEKYDDIRTFLDDSNSFNLEEERENDEKNSLIEQIEVLRSSLMASGHENLDNIPIVSKNSSLKDIQDIYAYLILKNNRHRCYTLGNEAILAGVKFVEKQFDGKTEYWGYKPNLTGWNSTVRGRLKRFRYEITSSVEQVFKWISPSPFTRIFIELFLNMIVYSQENSQVRNDSIANDAFNDFDFKRASQVLADK